MKVYSEPLDVDDATCAFPANVIGELIPARSELPEEFRKNWTRNKWCQIAQGLFFKGGGFPVSDRIDKSKAVRHLQAVLGSFEPKHEHKIGAAGFLLALWNDDYTWNTD